MASHFEKGTAAKYIDLQKPNLEIGAFSMNVWAVPDMIALEHERILYNSRAPGPQLIYA